MHVWFTIFQCRHNSMGNIWTADVYNLYKTLLLAIFGPFQIKIPSWCPLKISDNQRLSDILGVG